MINIYLNEEIIHYVASFLEHYDVQNKSHQKAVKETRRISNELIENLNKAVEIKIIRHKKED